MFIVFEGIDGCGKTTMSTRLESHLIKCGHRVARTSDLMGTAFGERVRAIFTSGESVICPMAEMLLMTSARLQNLTEVVVPRLAQGDVVISDRFYGTTYAYQAHPGKMPMDEFETLCVKPLAIKPDLTIYLQMPADLSRAAARGRLDRIESRSVEYFEKVKEGFDLLAQDPGYAVVDATRSVEEVFEQVLKAVEKALPSIQLHVRESRDGTCCEPS